MEECRMPLDYMEDLHIAVAFGHHTDLRDRRRSSSLPRPHTDLSTNQRLIITLLSPSCLAVEAQVASGKKASAKTCY